MFSEQVHLRRSAWLAAVLWLVSLSACLGQNSGAVMGYLNVRDFGAVGDGIADDTAAIQAALQAAGKPTPGNLQQVLPTGVYLPKGIYRLTRTLELGADDLLVHLQGGGTVSPRGKPQACLKWDGPQGAPLLNIAGYTGLRLSDLYLDGSERAGVLVRINSRPGVGTGNLYFERVWLVRGDTGFEFGADMDSCASDMTFVDCWIQHCKSAGFRTMAPQNVDYLILRCGVTNTPIGFHFYRGGNAHFVLPCFGRVFTAIKIEAGGINGGVFTITGLQQETFAYDNERKRFTTLEAEGEVNVSISGIYTGCGNLWGDNADLTTPNFILGPNAQVTVRDSMISGKIAVLKGKPNDLATWLQFDNCRFRCAADPRTDIEADAYSGYELRNCHVVKDDTLGKDYKVIESVLIPHWVQYPAQARIVEQ